MIGITILVVVLAAGTIVGLALRSRAGEVRTSNSSGSPELYSLLVEAGAVGGAKTVLHFSAEWCGPCAAVRRVVGQVVDEVGGSEEFDGPVELELDIDAYPALARAMNVMSLPTTFVLDEDLNEKARISGVPKSEALRSALTNQ